MNFSGAIRAAFLVLPLTVLPTAVSQQTAHVELSVDLVLLNVAVTDQKDGQIVKGLNKEDFKVYEDKVEQSINSLSLEEQPVSWGLVLDRSRSMSGMIRDVHEAALHILDEGSAKDEMFIAAFNNKVELVRDFTSDRLALANSLAGLQADGGTALYDALAFGLDHIKRGQYQKKVLVVVTDGEDNKSRVSFNKLVQQGREAGVLIYLVEMFEPIQLPRSQLKGYNPRFPLERLAELTGAYAYFASNIERCRTTMDRIAREVSDQYVLGYYPTNRTHDGKWRKTKVVVSKPTNARYIARARQGYYAPLD
jgi:Ca-activated chloride channel family protein